MSDDEIANLCRLWSHLNRRMIGLMKPCEARRGILFLSRDASADQAARELGEMLTRSILAFNFARKAPSKKEWNERVAFLIDPNAGVTLFKSRPKKPCIIIASLDRAPKWLHARLKALMDHTGVRAFNCLATATTLELIPEGLSGHFWKCRKIGRPKLL